MDVVFRCRTALHLPRNGSLSLGRSRPVPSWDNVLISRNHVQLQLQQDGALLDLLVTGRNAVFVERQAQEESSWDMVALVDPGKSALLPVDTAHAMRFYVDGAREETTVELRPATALEPPASDPEGLPPSAKRQRVGSTHPMAAAETASGATGTASPTGAAAGGSAAAADPPAAVTGRSRSATTPSAHRPTGASSPSSSSSSPSESPRRRVVGSLPPATAAPMPFTSSSNGATGSRAAAEPAAAVGAPPADTAAPYDINSPVHLLRVRGLAPRFNSGCLGVHFRRLVAGRMQLALVVNFMVDMGWLLSCCPDLATAHQLFVVHGEDKDRDEPEMRQQAAAAGAGHVLLHRPPTPSYGTHHSKAFLLTYPTGLRLVIHTANCVSPDCNDKSQGVWVQDFPRKAQQQQQYGASAAAAPAPASSPFERDLAAYFRALALPPAMAGPLFEAIAAHDFSYARGALVASVPGYHRGAAAVQSYGHMRLRRLLEHVSLPAGFQGSTDTTPPAAVATAAAAGPSTSAAAAAISEGLVVQCSSMGSFDQAWLVDEFGASLAAHRRQPPGQRQLQPPPTALAAALAAAPPRPSGPPGCGPLPLAVVWPTVEEVRNSVEGWNAGRSIPGPSKNVNKPFLGRYYARWGGEAVGRQRAMPHIKTYTRYRGQQLAWFMVTSHNLSKAAWGQLQKNGSQLHILSYELGVLVTPALEAAYRSSPQYGFCCNNSGSAAALQDKQHHQRAAASSVASATAASSAAAAAAAAAAAPACVTFWALAGAPGGGNANSTGGDGEVACEIPVPYTLPPTPYRTGAVDKPWTVDTPQSGLDALGLPFGSAYSHYGHTQED